MSVYVFCQALSETSALFKRMQTDARIYALYVALLPLGNGPFHPSEFDPDELADTLDHLEQTEPALFTTSQAVTQTLDELKREIREACKRYPGVELRACFLDKTYEEIYERLSGRLTVDQEESLPSVLPLLFSGDPQSITPIGMDESNGRLGVVSAALVHQAASVLQGLPPEELFDPEAEDWLVEDYGSWRTVYLEAAMRDEAIVIG